MAPRVEIVADLPAVEGQRSSPKRDVARDARAIPSEACLLDASPPIDHEAIATAFGRLLGHLEPDRPDAEPAESQADLLALIAGLAVLEAARRHHQRRSAPGSARPRRAPRSTLWGLS